MRAEPLWRGAARAAYDLVFPRRCPFCGAVIGWMPRCEECLPRAEEILHRPFLLPATEHKLENLEGAASLFLYKDPARRAILEMKRGGRPWYAREFGYALARRLFGCTFEVRHGIITLNYPGPRLPYDRVVSVPSSRVDRPYDSTARMAAALAEALGIPFEKGALVRSRQAKPQTDLSGEERLTNPVRSMKAASPQRLDGRRILLVDDVITTGATISEAARALLEAGALEVFGVSIAASEIEAPQKQQTSEKKTP